MKTNCVVLNYNDADTTEKLVEEIRGYRCFNRIVVVDNASTDASLQRLKKLEAENQMVIVLSADHNGGYGAGNNLGVKYSIEADGATHVVIANPDVSFTEDCIRSMETVFQKHPDVGVTAAVMEDAAYGTQQNGWPLHGFFGELLSMGPVSRRLFRRWLVYPERYFERKKAAYVDGVHGSMLMVSGEAFAECGGYDEGIFLYQEEAVLARRMKQTGWRTVLLLTSKYRHEHSASIDKTYESQIIRQKLRHESVMYYFRNYLHINPVQEAVAKLWFAGILLEIKAAGAVSRLFC